MKATALGCVIGGALGAAVSGDWKLGAVTALVSFAMLATIRKILVP